MPDRAAQHERKHEWSKPKPCPGVGRSPRIPPIRRGPTSRQCETFPQESTAPQVEMTVSVPEAQESEEAQAIGPRFHPMIVVKSKSASRKLAARRSRDHGADARHWGTRSATARHERKRGVGTSHLPDPEAEGCVPENSERYR